MVFISVTAILASLLVWRNRINQKGFVLATVLLLFLYLTGGLIWLVANHLSGDGFNDAVWYHLNTDLSGTGWSDFIGLIVAAVIGFICILIICFVLGRFVHTADKARSSSIFVLIGFVLGTVSLVLHPLTQDGLALRSIHAKLSSQGENTSTPDNFVMPTPAGFSGPRKNLIFLYLESVEDTYLDEDMFPGLTPNIKRIQEQSLVFKDVKQVYNSGWTIAGMVTSQCGFPLTSSVDSGRANYFHLQLSVLDSFMQKATCLGDTLNESGYELSYIGGGRSEFAGKRNFYNDHGFNTIKGLDDFEGKFEDKRYRTTWGLFDDTLFDWLKEHHAKLVKADQPYGLFALTLDTHNPNGHPSKSCDDAPYDDGKNPILNAVHCTDKLAGEFVDYLRQSPDYKDTIIVLTSDHLALRNTASSMLKKVGNRRNLFMVTGGGVEPGVIGRPASQMDIAPTVLGLLNAPTDKYGFGVDLNGSSQTMIEVMGAKESDAYLQSQSSFMRSFWEYPQLEEQNYFKSGGRLALGSHDLPTPMLMLLDEDMKVVDIRFSGRNVFRSAIGNLQKDQRFFWVDKCNHVAGIVDKPVSNSAGDGDDCYVIGRLNQAKPLSANLINFNFSQTDQRLPLTDFQSAFSVPVSDEDYAYRIKRIEAALNR